MSGVDALLRSAWVASLATLVVVVLGVPVARWLARRRDGWGDLASTLVMLPMVLPPTVVGYGLLLLVGRSSGAGRAWEALVGQPLVFSPAAAVLAAIVAAFPFLVRTAQAGFEQVDARLEDAARTLGATELAVFVRVSVPLAARSLVGGTALAFARAMGEFGATVMLAGNIPGRTQTASVAVYDAVAAGRSSDAASLALALAVLSGAVLFAVTRVGVR